MKIKALSPSVISPYLRNGNLFAKTFILAVCLIFGLLPVFAKTTVSLNDYQLAEVTGDNINIRTGAGANFPKAYTVYTDWNGKKAKTEVIPAYKGDRFFVKDAGDWYEIDTPSKVDGDSPRYISKKYARIIETEPFDLSSTTEPQTWGFVEKITYGDEEFGESEESSQATLVTIYPNGLAVTQFYSLEGDAIYLGQVNEKTGAILNMMNVSVGSTGNDVPANTPAKIWAETNINPPCLMWEYGDNAKGSFTFNGEKIEYVDVAKFPADFWLGLAKQLQNSPDYRSIRMYRSNPDAYTLHDDLSKFVRVK